MTTPSDAEPVRWGVRRAVMRDHTVDERASTPLELLFDLCFVVAVAFLAGELHHGVVAGHTLEAVARYGLLFIPIWWAWMSYTWFATAFSHDDAVTRLLTFAQMAGVLAVAAAVPAAASGRLVPFAVAYSLMRLPLILQWLRAARDDPPHRRFALTYAIGSAAAQLLWVTGAVLGGVVGAATFVVALGIELATPVRAVRGTGDRVFHARHIAERYGLFTIIVLGETVLAGTVGLRESIDALVLDAAVVALVGGGLVIAFALWWAYFAALGPDALVRNRRAAFAWGYGHYLLYAAIAAIGAGLQAQLELDESSHSTVLAPEGGVTSASIAPSGAGAAVIAAAVAVCLLVLAWLRRTADPTSPVAPALVAAAAAGVLAGWATLGGGPVPAVLGVAAVAVLAGAMTRPR